MKQEDKQYEKWLTELKIRQPVLENPEELTTTILNRISRISSGSKRKKYLVGAWLSGVAATVLLLLFINDTYFLPTVQQAETQNEYLNRTNSPSHSLPDNWDEMKPLEKNKYLSSQYTQRKQLRQARISRFIKEYRLK